MKMSPLQYRQYRQRLLSVSKLIGIGIFMHKLRDTLHNNSVFTLFFALSVSKNFQAETLRDILETDNLMCSSLFLAYGAHFGDRCLVIDGLKWLLMLPECCFTHLLNVSKLMHTSTISVTDLSLSVTKAAL